MLYELELRGRRRRLWQRSGESYGHVLLKALGYAMFVEEHLRARDCRSRSEPAP